MFWLADHVCGPRTLTRLDENSCLIWSHARHNSTQKTHKKYILSCLGRGFPHNLLTSFVHTQLWVEHPVAACSSHGSLDDHFPHPAYAAGYSRPAHHPMNDAAIIGHQSSNTLASFICKCFLIRGLQPSSPIQTQQDNMCPQAPASGQAHSMTDACQCRPVSYPSRQNNKACDGRDCGHAQQWQDVFCHVTA